MFPNEIIVSEFWMSIYLFPSVSRICPWQFCRRNRRHGRLRTGPPQPWSWFASHTRLSAIIIVASWFQVELSAVWKDTHAYRLEIFTVFPRFLVLTTHFPLMHMSRLPGLQGVPSITMSFNITLKYLFFGLQWSWQGVSESNNNIREFKTSWICQSVV